MLVNLSGADYVEIDGSISATINSCCPLSAASRDITFSNTSASASGGVIWLGTTGANDPVTHCTVQNCIIMGNASTTTQVALGVGGSVIGNSGSNNDFISFVNNDIRAALFKWSVDNQKTILSLQKEVQKLEDVFQQLTGN